VLCKETPSQINGVENFPKMNLNRINNQWVANGRYAMIPASDVIHYAITILQHDAEKKRKAEKKLRRKK